MGAVEHAEAFPACIALDESLPLHGARLARTLEAKLGPQFRPALVALGEELAVAEAELLTGLDVAEGAEDELPTRGVPVVVHVRDAGVVEARADEEDAALLGDMAVCVVAAAWQNVCLEDAQCLGVSAAVAVVQPEVFFLLLGRALGERAKNGGVPSNNALREERRFGEDGFPSLEVPEAYDAYPFPRDICDVEVVFRKEVAHERGFSCLPIRLTKIHASQMLYLEV